MLNRVLPQYWFSDSPHSGGLLVGPNIEGINVIDSILQLDLRNPKTQKAASIWIDLKSKRVVRSVADGQEMDVKNLGAKPYALPLKN
jgi:hypothetical protein